MSTVTETSLKIWDTLSGSPILRAATPSNSSSVAYPRAESVSSMDLDDHEHEDVLRAACDCDSVIDVFDDDFGEFSIMCFERVVGSKSMIAPNGKKIQNYNPVLPRLIAADTLAWSPLLDSKGNEGHRYTLVLGGTEQARIEVFTSHDALLKIVLAHGTHTRLAHHSGTAAKCSILKFATPQQHIEKLKAVVNSRATIYLPVKELVIGPALHGLRLSCVEGFEHHGLASIAPSVWAAAKHALQTISDLTRQHIDSHNRTEFSRVGLI